METIQQLIDKYGPAIVAAAQKQVQVAIAQDWMWAWGGIALLVIAAVLLVVGFTGGYETEPALFAGFLLAIPGLIICALAFGEINTYTQNPEWGVIKMISALVPK